MQADRLRKSGVYALWRNDNGPLAAADRAVLGLGPPQGRESWAAIGHDGQAPAAIFEHRAGACHTVLVGEVEEAPDLAASLGLSREASIGRVAAAALAKFGRDTPLHLIGEWSLLHRAASGTVTAMISAARRDPVLFVQKGPLFVVAPDLFTLARLDWVDCTIDPAGLLFGLGREALRMQRGETTMLAGIRQLQSGQTLIVTADGHFTVQSCDPFVPQERVSGSYADLVAQAEDLLARISAERAARAPHQAILLSGGLDSSLLAAFAVEAGDSTPSCISSVAPVGSRLPDEAHFAQLAAAALAIPMFPVAPDEALDAYRPCAHILSGANGPLLSNRHTLTEALQLAGRSIGAERLVNGSFGELTLTSRLPPQSARLRLRARAAAAWHRLSPPGNPAIDSHPFLVRIAPHLLRDLPEPITAALADQTNDPDWPQSDGLFGYYPGADKALRQSNEFYPGALRMDYPFRDLRLLRFFAGLPIKTLLEGGHHRPIVRSLLEGRLPDAIRLRTQGMPASPDHLPRLQRHATQAQQRVAEFRRADIDEWLDLDWLEESLGSVAQRGARDVSEANQVQLTAICAEFLLWWRERS